MEASLDAEDTFWTLDGRFVFSPRQVDIGRLWGAKRMQETIPPERWGRFLEADKEAADTLGRLFEKASGHVPDTFAMSINNDRTLQEVADFKGSLKPMPLFLDAGEREDTRRMAYVLIHDPEARAMLSEITRRRDTFVKEGRA